jgi:hypothetical protein
MYEHVQTRSDKDDLDAELVANVDAACHQLARFVTRSIAKGFSELSGRWMENLAYCKRSTVCGMDRKTLNGGAA